MDTPPSRAGARPPHQSSKPSPPLLAISATTSPSRGGDHHDFSFLASPFGGHLLPLPLSMSRTPVVGRVGSDLSHARASHHHAATTTSNADGGTASSKDRDSRAKTNKASPFFSGIGAAWRKENSGGGGGGGGGDVTGKQAEEKRKDRAKRAAQDVGQWVKRHMASMVEQLRLRAARSFFSRQSWESSREQRQRRRPHSFSAGHGPAREMRERERWRRARRGQLLSSAPASLRVSPANSGHLSVGGSVKVSTSSSEESTMEELQSAIEAAIAHCKNSISVAKQTAAAAAGDDDDTKLQ